jgi:DNA-directed RNA polymerase subunit RPC12/RpoP
MSLSYPDTADFYVNCKDCNHQWVAATAPMEATAFINKVLENDTCPHCGGKHIMCSWSKK